LRAAADFFRKKLTKSFLDKQQCSTAPCHCTNKISVKRTKAKLQVIINVIKTRIFENCQKCVSYFKTSKKRLFFRQTWPLTGLPAYFKSPPFITWLSNVYQKSKTLQKCLF